MILASEVVEAVVGLVSFRIDLTRNGIVACRMVYQQPATQLLINDPIEQHPSYDHASHYKFSAYSLLKVKSHDELWRYLPAASHYLC